MVLSYVLLIIFAATLIRSTFGFGEALDRTVGSHCDALLSLVASSSGSGDFSGALPQSPHGARRICKVCLHRSGRRRPPLAAGGDLREVVTAPGLNILNSSSQYNAFLPANMSFAAAHYTESCHGVWIAEVTSSLPETGPNVNSFAIHSLPVIRTELEEWRSL